MKDILQIKDYIDEHNITKSNKLKNKLKQFISVFYKILVIILIIIFMAIFAVIPITIIDTPYFIIPWIIFIVALYTTISICLFTPVDEK